MSQVEIITYFLLIKCSYPISSCPTLGCSEEIEEIEKLTQKFHLVKCSPIGPQGDNHIVPDIDHVDNGGMLSGRKPLLTGSPGLTPVLPAGTYTQENSF